MKKTFFYTISFLLTIQIIRNQSKVFYLQMHPPSDSVSRSIDSLISKKTFSDFSISSRNASTRKYYIDYKNLCVVKCIVDTAFEDFHNKKYSQVIIYFYKGHEFSTLWIEAKTSKIGFAYSWEDILKVSKDSWGIGKFKKGWGKQKIDRIIREHIYLRIANMKFMQGRNFGN